MFPSIHAVLRDEAISEFRAAVELAKADPVMFRNMEGLAKQQIGLLEINEATFMDLDWSVLTRL